MRVLHVETGRHLYGGALQVRYLLEGLSRMGVENHLAAPPGSAVLKESQEYATPHETPVAGDIDILFPFRLIRLIRRVLPDILHVHSRRGADLWGAVAARVTGIPSVVTRRVDNPEPGWLSRLKYRSFRHVIAISGKIAQVLTSQGVEPSRVSVIRSAVDASKYAHACDRRWFDAQFSVSPDQPVIGVVAQLIERKGHRTLIEAMPQILTTHPETRFVFFGKGPEEHALKTLCRLKNLQSQVMFAGFRENMERILPCLALVVHPAKMEGLGVALLQASAAGVPIVACRAGGIPEVVEDSITGLLVPPDAPIPLAQAVCHLLSHPEKGGKFGENGQRRVARLFSIEAMVKEYIKVYQRVERHAVPSKNGPTRPFQPKDS